MVCLSELPRRPWYILYLQEPSTAEETNLPNENYLSLHNHNLFFVLTQQVKASNVFHLKKTR